MNTELSIRVLKSCLSTHNVQEVREQGWSHLIRSRAGGEHRSDPGSHYSSLPQQEQPLKPNCPLDARIVWAQSLLGCTQVLPPELMRITENLLCKDTVSNAFVLG